MSRFEHQPDHNRPAILAALTAAGADIELLDAVGLDVPDLLVGFGGHLHLLEVKNPKTHPHRNPMRALRKGQREFFRKWRGYRVHVVFTPRQALRAIGAL